MNMRNILIFILLAIISISARAHQITEAEITQILIEQSVSSYLNSVGNCPCPYNRDRAGRSCGKRSAWSRAGGYAPLCYPDDVTSDMIQRYNNTIPSQNSDHVDGSVSGTTPDTGGDEGPLITPSETKKHDYNY